MSKATATQVVEQGPVTDRSGQLDDYSISFVSFAVDIDGAPLLTGLPDNQCQCPHWGYVLKGSATFTFGDRTETYDEGDAFYTPPGHTPAHSADSELVLFSPTDQLAPTIETMRRNMQAMSGG
jgi:glyoxylate utilization-related uncharacterized protein